MRYVVSAGDMFWTGSIWTWERNEAQEFMSYLPAEAIRLDMIKDQMLLSDLIGVRMYLST